MRPFSPAGIDHVVLRVRDIDASAHFYTVVLGGQLVRSLPELGLYQYRFGGQLIDLVPIGTRLGGDNPPDPDVRNMDHLCLIIDPFDEDALGEYLASNGITASEVATRYGAAGYGPSLYITDPDGHTIELKGPEGTDAP